MPSPLVSIALVTRNGADTLPMLIDALRRQRVDCAFEIVAVDSGSTDGSAELLARKVDHFISIDSGTFNHGLTRNLAIERSNGDLIVLIVQDAVPADERWLHELTRPMRTDPGLAGTFARQHPRPGASAITRSYLTGAAIARVESQELLPITETELAALEPMARLRRCTFDNVCSCIRRSIWREIPFRETPIAEDLEWAKEVLLAGYRLQYVPSAVAIHSHERTARYELARTFALHRRLYELFEVRTISSWTSLVRAVASSLARHFRCVRSSVRDWPRAAALAVAWPLGQYLGAKSAVGRWKLRTPRNV